MKVVFESEEIRCRELGPVFEKKSSTVHNIRAVGPSTTTAAKPDRVHCCGSDDHSLLKVGSFMGEASRSRELRRPQENSYKPNVVDRRD